MVSSIQVKLDALAASTTTLGDRLTAGIAGVASDVAYLKANSGADTTALEASLAALSPVADALDALDAENPEVPPVEPVV